MPGTFAVVVCGAFFMVGLVFFLYDGFGKRRHNELVNSAVRSHKVVTSLFPGDMQDQVLARQTVAVAGVTKSVVAKRKSSLQFEEAPKLTPLAREYSHATIFFGDLAGFTRWSSTRTPEHVFELLEALYSAFDQIAQKRNVFKVETVGDCYGEKPNIVGCESCAKYPMRNG